MLAENNLTQEQISKMFGVSSHLINLINKGKIWKHIKYQPTINQPITIQQLTINANTVNIHQSNQSEPKEYKQLEIFE